MKRKASLYIKDIIDSITKIEEFVGNMNFKDFTTDDKTSSAVIRKLEIIGEATKQLPESIRNRFKEIPWPAMAKTRDKIIHFYHGVDYEIIWEIIKKDLPLLKSKLAKIYDLLLKEEHSK
ncbi:DUF86 domain-containing protein [Thermosipho ferrireducens]|uniref:DUF86 domain-containing protein n=1 Tax=Thermosipho ferrireducens TaxID=2571116 RepID=A0ABX7S8T5_9BACT|nr:DUF86 domain-containing protein [Thermosipho ferrireducens]QTA38215.1 DUF86 domain-containing protein [Thermosipho ferrireducens]